MFISLGETKVNSANIREFSSLRFGIDGPFVEVIFTDGTKAIYKCELDQYVELGVQIIPAQTGCQVVDYDDETHTVTLYPIAAFKYYGEALDLHPMPIGLTNSKVVLLPNGRVFVPEASEYDSLDHYLSEKRKKIPA